ncbi:MAG: DUF2059 domain-containing protein [Holophagales bacterium]|nr:DUF2059 domain-containing protein [Holophagales bacterium]
MSPRIALLLLLVSSPVAALAEETPTAVEAEAVTESEQLARRLMEVSGSGEMAEQILAQMVDSFRTTQPNVSSEFWDGILANARGEELEELMLPIYLEILTDAEMRAAIAFYETPEGRSLIQKMPLLLQKSMAVGQEWGERLARDVIRRLKERREANPNA